MDTDDLLNERGLAAVLQLPLRWIVNEADCGRIPCLRVGRRRLFSLASVQAALIERARTCGASLKAGTLNDENKQ